jgi:predicted Zn-dependent protease
MRRIEFRPGESLPGRVYEMKKPMRVDEVQFTRDYTFSTEGLLLYRQATGGRLPVSSLLVPIQAGDYSVGVSGFEIVNGQKSAPVSEITIAGNVKDIFKTIIAADDNEYKSSVDCPSLLIPTMTIAGA